MSANPNRAANLDTAIDQVVARIAEVTASAAPDYSIDGVSISKASYLQTLTGQLLALEQARQRADGAFEVQSLGI